MEVLKAVFALVFMSCLVQGKITLHKFEDCDAKADYPIKMKFTLKEGDGMQVIEEGTVNSKVPMGNNIQEIIEVYSKENNGEYEHVITLKESLCDAVNKFMGEFMHEMQKAAGLEPGVCPVPAGEYTIKDHALDFQKFKFKKIPEGDFRVVVNLLEASTNETLNCHNVEFSLQK